MKNFIKHLFMLCLFGMISIGAKAETKSGSCGDNATWSFDTETGLLSITGSGDMEDCGWSFAPWYEYRNNITSLSIGDQITSIGECAFYECSGLTSVTIGNSVTEIGNEAFKRCFKLTSVTIPNFVTSIGNSAFYYCSGLTSVTIPNFVTSIGNFAFYNCSGLTSVTIPNSVTSIGDYAFSGCTSLPVENSLRYADTYLVEAVDKTLSTYTIKEGTKWIGSLAFHSCESLKSVTIPNFVTSIGNSAFYNCSGLKSVTIPNSVTKIENSTFYNCNSLTSVTIPNSVTSIGSFAFSGCFKLTSVTIPNSVTSIGKGAFSGCSSLTSVYITNLDKWAEIEFGGFYANPLYYAHSLYLDEQLVTEAKLTTATKIGDYAFDGCSGLTSVTIPNSVTSIGEGAFEDCKGLTSVAIPNSVTSIGDYAFDGCSAMRSVYVGWDKESDIPSIDYSTFPYSQCTLYVPQGAAELYLAKEYWKTFKSIYGGLIIEDKDGNKTSVPIADSNPSFTLSDDINSINNSGIIRDVTITYTRKFDKAGVWQAWYMPFDVAFDDMKDAYDVAQIHGVLLDKDNNAVLAFLKLDKGTVNANTPYVVRPKKSGEVAITTTTDLQPTVSKSFDLKSATDIYYLGGVYEQTTTPGNWYALNLDGQFQLMGSGVYLRPFRIYMTIDPRTDNPYAQSASTTAKMDIVVIGDGETTGIKESLTPALSEGKGAIYNLSGLRVNSIQKGQIYIMNGKKFIAK